MIELNREKVLRLHRKFDKAIIERKIRKTDKNADLVKELADKLKETYYNFDKLKNKTTGTIIFKVKEENYKRILEVTEFSKIYPAVALMKRFVNLSSESDIDRDKLEKWLKSAKNTEIPRKDKSKALLKNTIKQVEEFLKSSNSKSLSIEAPLSGLSSCAAPQNKVMLMSAADMANKKLHHIGFDGKWKSTIGDATVGFSMLVYGSPGSGKSTFLLQFANYLTKFGKVLYVSGEEYGSATLIEKIQRLNISNKDIMFAPNLSGFNGDYEFVIIDSKDNIGLTLDDFKRLKANYKNTSFIMVSQVTKEGTARGSEEWIHEVDTVIRLSSGSASSEGQKNRMRSDRYGSDKLKVY